MDITKIWISIFFLVKSVHSFNLQSISKSIVFGSDRKGTDFGYSVALHENSAGKWLLVGAPKDYLGETPSNSRLPRDGAIYSCQLMERKGEGTMIVKKGRCNRIDMETLKVAKKIFFFNNFEFANMTQQKDDDFDWELHTGPTSSDKTGPPHDHTHKSPTRGKYMLLECSAPRSAGQTARLSSPVLPATNFACLRFWYHMYGESMGSFNVYMFTKSTGSRMIWSRDGDKGDEWFEGWVTLISDEPYNIIFEGVVGLNYDSDVGIDDIMVVDRVCPEDNSPANQLLGMTLTTSTKTGQVMACAPTWSYSCPYQNHSSGACYLFDRNLQPTSLQMLAPCRSRSCSEGKMDLIFLIDGSTSIIRDDFKKMIVWLKNVASTLPIGRDLTRVGVAQFATKSRSEFHLNEYFRLEEMKKAISRITRMGGHTATGAAINFISEEMFTKGRGFRSDAKQVAVVITDGKASDNVTDPATKAKAKGLKIFAIGVGAYLEKELQDIASDPDDEFVYGVENYQGLNKIRDQLQKKLFSLESQGSALTTEKCQAGLAADFVHGQPIIGLPGLHDWSGGFALYSKPNRTNLRVLSSSFQDLVPLPEEDITTMKSVKLANPICNQPSDTGPCRASFPKWFYNTDTEECELFIYGGCEGNENNFEMPEECMEICGAKIANTSSRPSKHFGTITSHEAVQSSIGSVQVSMKMRSKTTYSKTSHSSTQYVNQKSSSRFKADDIRLSMKPQGLKSSSDIEVAKGLLSKLHESRSEKDDFVKGMLRNSYMGYSVSSGSYTQMSAVEIAISAPRTLSIGSVFIVQLNEHEEDAGDINEPVIMAELAGDQMGSYFGYSTCMTDMNGDGLDELIVGAPLWMGKYQDMGQAVVYLSDLGDDGTPLPRLRFVLHGSSEINSRFGFAIAEAGDLNQDGFSDVVIGAPSNSEGDGAVYVYNGGISVERMKIPTQIIRASETNKKLVYFGFSFNRGLDIDDNGYNDIACGAPGSDRALVLFSKPVIHVTVDMIAIPSLVNISSASCNIANTLMPKNMPKLCSVVNICLNVKGLNIPETVYLNYNLKADAERPWEQSRAHFHGLDASMEIAALANNITCFNATLIFKDPIRDLSTDLVVEMSYSLSYKTSDAGTSVLDVYNENPAIAEVAFARDCESEECKSDLKVECLIKCTQPYLGSEVIVFDENRIISVNVNLTNAAEDAYDVEIDVKYNAHLFLRKLNVLQINRCIVIVQDEDDVPGYMKLEDEGCKDCDRIKREEPRMKTLRLIYKDSIMGNNDRCRFELQFGLHDSEVFTGGNISISVESKSANQDLVLDDNTCERTIPVYFEAAVGVSGYTGDEQVRFGGTKAIDSISTFEDIGPGVSHSYFVANVGHSTIPISTIEISWPSETMSGHDIFYLSSMRCSPPEKCHCKDLDILINPDQINMTDSMEVQLNRGKEKVAIVDSGNETDAIIDSNGDDIQVEVECNENGILCDRMICHITQLKPSETMEIILNFRLWQDTFVKVNAWKASITTNASFTTEMSPYIVTPSKYFTHRVTTFAYSNLVHPKRDDVGPVSPRIWVIALSIFAGIALLLLTTYGLYRAGFFESKYKMIKDESENRDRNESSPLDRVSYDDGTEQANGPQRLSTFQRTDLTESPTL